MADPDADAGPGAVAGCAAAANAANAAEAVVGPAGASAASRTLASAAIAPATPEAIEAAAERLAAGGLVAFPTETVYGLGADAGNATAVAAIYAAKGRPADHPLIVHVADADAGSWWARWPEAARTLARRFWPGPLTLILPRAPRAPAHACAGQATIGLRSPAHPVARALLARFQAHGGRGLAAPSANRFGRISPTRAQHVLDDLGEAAPPILDGGDAPVGIESTIVDLSRGAPVLLRPGAIGLDALQAALGEPVAVSANVLDPRQADANAPRASGTLASHYAPRTPLRVVDRASVGQVLAEARARGWRVAVWRQAAVNGPEGAVHGPEAAANGPKAAGNGPEAAGNGPEAASGVAPGASESMMASASASASASAAAAAAADPTADLQRLAPSDPAAYARALYATLRELDMAGCDLIVVEAPPRDPGWQAVWDRLSRAATR